MITRRRMLGAALLAFIPVALPASARDAAEPNGGLTESESNAVSILRRYASAEASYYAANKRYATVSQLVAAEYVDKAYSDGSEHSGYRFMLSGFGPNGFDIEAEPITPESGRYSFNVIEDYVIRFEKGPRAPSRTEGKVVGVDPFE